MRRLYVSVVLLLGTIFSYSQVNYTFSAASGTYSPITGTVPTFTDVGIYPASDEGFQNAIPLGFTFKYNGTDFTTVGICANGFAYFGTLNTTTFGNSLTNGNLPTRPILAPFWNDLDMQTVSNINYLSSGTAPNRVFTIQWSNALIDYTATAASLSFQVKLYETTNVVEFIYNPLAGAIVDDGFSGGASIGITSTGTGNGNYISLQSTSTSPATSTTVEMTQIITKPAAGQIYRFTPLSGCTGTPTAGTAAAPAQACTNSFVNLTLTGFTAGAGITFQWQSSPLGANTFTNIAGATTANYNAFFTAATDYRCIVTCTNGGATATSNTVSVTVKTTGCVINDEACGAIALIKDGAQECANTTTATSVNDPALTCSSPNNTVWYKYTATATQTVQVLLTPPAGAAGTVDTLRGWLAVYVSPTSCPSLTFQDSTTNSMGVSCVGFGAAGNAGITTDFRVVAGRTYYLLIDGNTGDVGLFCIQIKSPPPCSPITGAVITTRTTSFMVLDWNASATATGGYEYVISNSPNNPAGAGTPEPGNSMVVAFGTFDDTKIYYLHVRGNCGANGFSAWAKAISIPCVTNTAPADGATNVDLPPTFNWTPVTGATAYRLYFSTDGGATYPLVTGAIVAPPVTLNGLSYSTSYKWFVRAINGADSSAFICNTTNGTSFTTIAPPPPPPNDLCANAVNLTIGAGFCATPVLGTLTSADSTNGLGTATCAGLGLKYDVWFKATVPATGKITVQTSAVNGVGNDLVLQAYSGACGSLVPVGCDDDGNPDPAPSAFHSKLGLSGRTPGEVIFYRVMAYDNVSRGAFAICAFDTTASVLPLVATGAANACTNAAAAINIDSAWKFTYVTFKDVSGNVIGQLYPNGSMLGSTTASFYLNSGAVRKDVNNINYLDRNFTFIPTTQPIGQVITRMYITNAELTALGAVSGGATRAQLNASKTQQTCAASAIAADATLLTQFGSGAYGANHFVEILPTSFSTFYLHKGNVALPVNYADLTGTRNGNKVDLTWITKTETNNRSFEVQRSADGRGFSAVGTVTSKAVGGNSVLPISYSFTDVLPLATTNYYRLKQTDIDGKVTYSNTVLVKGLKPSLFSLNTIFPNPARERITAALQSPFADNVTLVITDMAGKIIKLQVANMAIGDNIVSLDVAALPAGSYLLKAVCNNGCESAVKKFNKL